MVLSWEYIKSVKLCGDAAADARVFLTVNNMAHTLKHSEEVAFAAEELARRFGLDENILRDAAMLHDIAAVIKPDDMLKYAVAENWYVDESERLHSFLLHQRFSELLAREYFGVQDCGVLSAVGCHSTLKANATRYDILLFLADKLAWDQKGEPPCRNAVISALDISPERAALAFICYVLNNNMVLHPHRWFLEAREWLKSVMLVLFSFMW